MKRRGKVYLVGAGPGAPDLITLRGLECLKAAEVVLYDQLCNPFILRHAPPEARQVFAGKHAGRKSLTQAEIQRLMLRFARDGKRVVRLKGGDPLLFGRGAEEAEFLFRHGIDFEIVPGISAAIGVPAYAGIPLTHRDLASGVALITAQENPCKEGEALDYRALAEFPGTLVVFMAFKSLKEVVGRLVAEGKSVRTPCAVVQWGTRGIQKTVCGPLNRIESLVRQAKLRAPALAVIGRVVECRRFMSWFERRPLWGRRVLVPRAREQSSELSKGLRDLGAEVLEIPLIEIVPLQSEKVRKSIEEVSRWDWVIFSSGWGVDFFFDEVMRVHGDLRVVAPVRFGVVGGSTRERLEGRGFRAQIVAKRMNGAGLIEEFRRRGREFEKRRVLLPRSKMGRPEIENALRSMGARVASIPFYRNRMPRWTWEGEAMRRLGFDTVVFTSSSTVERFAALEAKRTRWGFPEKKEICCISIGSTTSRTLREHGFRVAAEARQPSVVELLRCVRHSVLDSSRIPVGP